MGTTKALSKDGPSCGFQAILKEQLSETRLEKDAASALEISDSIPPLSSHDEHETLKPPKPPDTQAQFKPNGSFDAGDLPATARLANTPLFQPKFGSTREEAFKLSYERAVALHRHCGQWSSEYGMKNLN